MWFHVFQQSWFYAYLTSTVEEMLNFHSYIIWAHLYWIALKWDMSCIGSSMEGILVVTSLSWTSHSSSLGSSLIDVVMTSGGVRPPSPPRHDTTVPEEPKTKDVDFHFDFQHYRFPTPSHQSCTQHYLTNGAYLGSPSLAVPNGACQGGTLLRATLPTWCIVWWCLPSATLTAMPT